MSRSYNQSAPQFTPSRSPETAVRIRSRSRRSGNLFLNMSIGGRLTLGFLIAALIAALVTGLIGIQRSQSLSRQSDFYQRLLQTNTSLTTGASFLQLMNSESHTLLDSASVGQPSQETLAQEQKALSELAARYDAILNTYISQDLLNHHPDQLALLDEAGQLGQANQQLTLAGSSVRTWRLYRTTLNQFLQDISARDLVNAQHLVRFQAEPTNADALSALRALTQLDQRLAGSVQEAASVEEQQQLLATIIGAALASLAIILVGWFISGTLVRRLRQLRQVTQAVEQGHLESRVDVIGRDEIAEVSASVNAMLEAIVRLIQETRHQRDVLTNAAEHLFSDMRVVSAGDLRINAPVSDDPIGLLANAFNFTVGRFRRFVLRVQSTTEQLDVIARQESEQTESFALLLNSPQPQSPGARPPTLARNAARLQRDSGAAQNPSEPQENEVQNLLTQVRRTREHLQRLSGDSQRQRLENLLALTRQASPTARGEYTTADQHLKAINGELQTLQQQTTRALIELDRDLTGLTTSLNKLKNRPGFVTNNDSLTPSVPLPASKDLLTSELTRQGTRFVAEISTLARQIAMLTQELRNGVVSFQLDTSDSPSALGSRSLPGIPPSEPYSQSLPPMHTMSKTPQ